MGFHWLLRMSMWARNPPSKERVMLVLGVIAVCLALYGIERWFGWPDWLTSEMTPRGRIIK